MAHHDDATQTVKTRAQELGEDIADAATAKANHAAASMHAQAQQEADQLAQAAEAASDAFPSGSVQSQIADQVAQQADRLAQTVAQMDAQAVIQDVSDFARRNPLVFVGGAALVGLLAARFLKARDTSGIAQSYGDDDPWRTGGATPRGGHDVTS